VIAVIDASVALKWFIEEAGSAQASALLTGPHTLIAPDLIIADVANAGWKAVRPGGITQDQHDHATARLPLAFDHLIPLTSLAPRGGDLTRPGSSGLRLLYLVLAEDRHATLVTADGRLLNRLQDTQWAPLAVDLHTLPPES
jgi:predicted nucleic acid-binding protein